jgi:phage tail sheath protein FI
MSYLQSVGVQITETDLTTVAQPTSASIGAYVGHFNWGPADQIINVSSEKRLGETFGTPKKSSDATSASFLTAESFLKYGNSLKVVRAVGASARNSKGEAASYNTNTANNVLIKNKDEYDLKSTSTLVDAFYARCPGLLGDSLSVQLFHANNISDLDLLATNKLYFANLPGTTTWASEVSSPTYTHDEVHVVVYDQNGEFTGVKGTVLETFEGLSFNADAKTVSGASNYWKDSINVGSQYIFVGDPADVQTLNVNTSTYSLDGNSAGLYTFTAGANGVRDIANVTNALDLFADSETVEVSLLFAEAFEDDTTAAINDKLAIIAKTRKDCMAFLSAPLELYKSSNDAAKLTEVKSAKEEVSDLSSFVVFDSSPVYVYNKYADKYEWVPACGHVAGLCAYTDNVADAWFSPAGYNRGQLRGVVKLAYNPVQVDRDELYSNNINPIVNVAGQGIVLLGDKTGQTRPSAFDRINVRRLFIALQKACATTSKFQLFEFNDQFTRNTFINTIEPLLRDVQSRRGITDYKIVCDETNNTAQVIDTNRFVADIYIKPARSINYITLNFIASRSGIAFNEIGA